MKTTAFIFVSFTFLLFYSCRKLTYPENEGIEIKRKDFNKTINGTWQIEKVWFTCLFPDSSCNHDPIDSASIYINKFGGKGRITIDYGKAWEINWYNNYLTHNNYLKYIFFDYNTNYFELRLSEKEINDANSIITSIIEGFISLRGDFQIEKLTASELIITGTSGIRIELIKL